MICVDISLKMSHKSAASLKHTMSGFQTSPLQVTLWLRTTQEDAHETPIYSHLERIELLRALCEDYTLWGIYTSGEPHNRHFNWGTKMDRVGKNPLGTSGWDSQLVGAPEETIRDASASRTRVPVHLPHCDLFITDKYIQCDCSADHPVYFWTLCFLPPDNFFFTHYLHRKKQLPHRAIISQMGQKTHIANFHLFWQVVKDKIIALNKFLEYKLVTWLHI